MAETAHPTATAPANAQTRYEVRRAELPLSCPTPAMALWNSHPRVYLPIEAEGGEAVPVLRRAFRARRLTAHASARRRPP